MKVNEVAVAEALEIALGECETCPLVNSDFVSAYRDYVPELVNYGFSREVSFEYLGHAGKYSFMLGTRPNGSQIVIWVNNNDNQCVDQVDGVEFLQSLMECETFIPSYY